LPRYEARFTRAFEQIIQSRKKKQRRLVEAAEKAVREILDGRFGSEGFLQGDLRGMRKKYVALPGGETYRVVFAVCSECLRLGHDKFNRDVYRHCAAFCASLDHDRTIVFFLVNPKKERHADYRL